MSGIAWSGVITGLITPFSPDDEIDCGSLERHLAFLCKSRVAGILTSAMMGEGGHLSAAERDAILKFTVERVRSEVPVIATIYGNSTREAAEEARRAAKRGAKGLLVFPHPSFAGFPLDPDVPATYFRAIWNAANLPMIVFRTPDSLAPKFDFDILEKLIEIPGVAAIKDSAAERDFYTGPSLSSLKRKSSVKVLIDCDPLIHEFIGLGADGATSICAAVYPEEYVAILEAKNTEEAESVVRVLQPFAEAVFSPPFRNFRARLKYALTLKGIIASERVRPPLLPLSESERKTIEKALGCVEAFRSKRPLEAP